MTDKLYLYLKYKVSYYPLFIGAQCAHYQFIMYFFFWILSYFSYAILHFWIKEWDFCGCFDLKRWTGTKIWFQCPLWNCQYEMLGGASTFPYLFSTNSLKIWIATILEYKLRCCSFEVVVYELKYLKKVFF